MGPVSATIAIDVPRERLFDLLVDLSARPSFTDHFLTEYRLLRVDPVGVGAGARFRLESGTWMDAEIEQADRPSLIRERGRGGHRLNRVPAFTVWELAEGAAPGSSEVTVTFWTEPVNSFDRLRELTGARRFFRRNWRRALARLKDLAEAERAPRRVAVAGADRLP